MRMYARVDRPAEPHAWPFAVLVLDYTAQVVIVHGVLVNNILGQNLLRRSASICYMCCSILKALKHTLKVLA